MSNVPVIELVAAGICRDPASEPVLLDVSLRVMPAEFWVVEGAHGSGKSLLLETMAGIRPCSAGELKWFGHPVNMALAEESGRAALRRRIGMVFEGGGRVFTQLTVAENLALPVSYHQGCPMDQALDRTGPLLAALDLVRMADAPAGRVGRGWMQRVALGRALSLQPEVLLLDTPLAGLDPWHSRWWLAFLRELATGHPVCSPRPMTLVVTTDDSGPWPGAGHEFAEVSDHRWRRLPGPRGAGPVASAPSRSPA